MVDMKVRQKVHEIIAAEHGECTVDWLIDYLFKCNVLDVNKCRIAIIKRHYYDLVESGLSCSEAKEITAGKFSKSVSTIDNIIYNPFYKGITI